MLIGYARVSTDDQSLALQIQALERVGCDRIYTDQGVSGGITSRPGLDRALGRLRAGDKLVVWRLDRLGRSLPHLIQVLDRLGRRKVLFHSLSEGIDTNSSGGRLVFHIMAALAEFERALISERTRAGLAAARMEGKVLGRRPALSSDQCRQAHQLLKQEHWSLLAVASHFGVHPRTVKRRLANYAKLCEEEGAGHG
ncbi:DNA resolvase [Pseudomonas oryzihabitans]|nr:DNA resolvase [Pseudomonas psychrotolerans]